MNDETISKASNKHWKLIATSILLENQETTTNQPKKTFYNQS